MDELTRARRVERIADGQRMECWGLESDGVTYRCSWYAGRDQMWGIYTKSEIRSVVKPAITTDRSTDWRSIKW